MPEQMAVSSSELQFSVVCPAYNSSKYILRTLQTVLDQTSPPHEIIIVDDGSSDGTPELVEAFLRSCSTHVAFSVLRTAHRGPGAARNAGIGAAKGDWIAFLDSDDIWFLGKLTAVREAIAADNGVNFVCHHEELVRLDGRVVGLDYAKDYDPHRPLPPQLFQKNLFSTSAIACRRQLLLDHGRFDETLMSAQDYELWLRLSPHISLRFIEERLGQYVERAGNITSGNWLRRMRNELRIAWRHRSKVHLFGLSRRFARIALTYSRVALKSVLSGR